MAVLFQTQGAPEVRKFLAQAAARVKDPRPALKPAGEEMLVRTQRRMRAGLDIHGRPFVRSRGADARGGQTLWDRGALASSANYTARRDGLDLFSTDRRARVHFEGETIKPKSAKFLTIPLRARGGMFQQRDVQASGNRSGARARHYKNTFFLRRNGRLLLMQKTGNNALRALFLLVRSVQLPRREWLGFGDGDVQMVADTIAKGIGDER